MAETAHEVGVSIVSGDTKVAGKAGGWRVYHDHRRRRDWKALIQLANAEPGDKDHRDWRRYVTAVRSLLERDRFGMEAM